jgi:hypothetical protein
MIAPRLPECCARCLAEEATKSWRISSQTRNRLQDQANTDLVTTYWIDIPLCAACHSRLRMVLGLFWVVGVMGGLVACCLLAQFMSASGGIDLGEDAVSIGVSLGVLALIVGIVACSVVWFLYLMFIESPLATYDPLTGRLSFGNKRYQQIYDQSNSFVYTKRSRLGI